MPFNDTTSIIGGFNQVISDWELGDDRVFTGTVTGLLPSDPSLASVYFTLKRNPNDIDSNAIWQTQVTQQQTPGGIITGTPVGSPPQLAFVNLFIHIYSGNYQSFVFPGTQYYWDFRGVTVGGSTVTIATGLVTFQQNVTRTNAAGLPAPIFLPNSGLPRFRGFLYTSPNYISTYDLVDINGDFYMNLLPSFGQPAGWQCTSSGSPGAWIPFMGGSNISSFVGIMDGPPTSNQIIYVQGNWIQNSHPVPGGMFGWVCCVGGAPGLWREFGNVSLL